MQSFLKGLSGDATGLFDLDLSASEAQTDVAAPGPEGPASDGPTLGEIVAYGDLSSLGGSGGGTTVTTGVTSSVTRVTTAGSGLVFNLTWDASVSSAPAAFRTDIINAATFLESQISTTATINLDVGYNEIAGSGLSSGALGESESYLVSVSYTALVAALRATASSDATDRAMLASLPSTAPVSGTWWVSTAQAKALGLEPAAGTSLDGYVGFGTASEFSYGDTNTSGTVAAGTYDFFATAVHELSETMGRMALVGDQVGGGAGYSLMDLTHYSASGVRDFTQSRAGYVSVNGGAASLGALNTIAGGDAGDWASSVTDDAFDAYATPGRLETVSSNDLALMDALGWNLTSAPPPAPPPPPTGVSIAAATASLSALQGTSGLAGGRAIATFTETGGVAGDTFSYSLGGTGAGSFTLSTSGVLSTATAGVTSGLKELTITATDVTRSVTSSAPAQSVNVVVGGAGADTITLSSIAGIVAAAPTFIYGLAGNDRIVGTGMTGTLYFDGGAGADTMTGGSGTNIYEYGAVSDSTPQAMDIITNFRVTSDRIDLTAVGAGFGVPVALASSAPTIAAGSIGGQVSGGTTFRYVNYTGRAETLSAASMKIELEGTVALTAANILHS